MLAHYRLLAKIGEGGMGVVWKAADTSLDREVAIKLLPPAFSADPDRLVRFEREAKLLASLNHAGIASIYGLHADGRQRFLAMELVEGEDLSERLLRGPVPVEEALGIAGEDLDSRLQPISRELTRAGKIFGTVAYMSPEQARDVGADHRSDVFSLGILLHEMDCGRLPPSWRRDLGERH